MPAEIKIKPQLNKEQHQAADTYKREGAFLVLAGPGTGKTFSVSQRIKSIIEAGTPAESITAAETVNDNNRFNENI